MKTKLLIAAALIGLALPVAAQFQTIQQAYEVALSEVRLPRNVNGTIAFKECEKCQYRTKRVSAQTRYLLDGHSIPLARFRDAMERVTNRNDEAVTILHHLKNNQVTEVSVNL